MLEFTATEDDTCSGDFDSLKAVEDIHPAVVDEGIGHYEFWGYEGVDKRLEAQIEEEGVTVKLIAVGTWQDPPDFEVLADLLVEQANIKPTIHFLDDDDIDEEEGRGYRRRRGTGISADFCIKSSVQKIESPTCAIINIFYE